MFKGQSKSASQIRKEKDKWVGYAWPRSARLEAELAQGSEAETGD